MGSKYDEYGAAAERLYVVEGKSDREISEVLPVRDTTVGRWRRNGDWERKRREYMSGPKSALELAENVMTNKLMELLDAGDGAVGLEEIKELTALVKAVNDLKKSYDLFEIAVLAGGEFVTFVDEYIENVDDKALIFEVWNEFVEEMRKR